MSNWGHVEKVTAEIGGKVYTFRSKLEYRWAVWCQLRKEQGLILEWWYEDETLELESPKFRDPIQYIPDFTIQTADGYEFEETKGWFTAKSATKIKMAAQQYENPITLIFAAKPNRVQYNRAEKLSKHIKRVIYNADRDIFRPIKHLFEV
jgi:hypothetical protein